jgi:hypothetical protein
VEIATALRPGIPALSEEIIAAIRIEVPAYQQPLEGAFGEGIRTAVEEALEQFVSMVGRPATDRRSMRRVYVDLGRGEARAGRSLESLLAAYRVGARVAWRRVAERAQEVGLGSNDIAVLAEAIFAYIDELSAESAEGHAREQSAAASEAGRRRRRLVALLLQSPPAAAEAVEAAAANVGWELPAHLAALVWRESGRPIAPRLPAQTLALERDGVFHGLVPDPDGPGRRRALARAVGEVPAALGPTVSWPQAQHSHERALAVARLFEEGRLTAGGLVAADDHLARLVLDADGQALSDLSARALRPLQGETPASRERLAQTLRAWLDHQGAVATVAAELHVHPQTVRYRLGRLRDCFGKGLDDPAQRFELTLALRAPGIDRPSSGG